MLDGVIGELMLRLERCMIETALACCNGNIARAARSLGIKRTTLSERIRGLDIDVSNFRDYIPREPVPEIVTSRQAAYIHAAPLREVIIEKVVECLRDHAWNRSQTAKALGISPRTIRNMIHEAEALGHEIKPNPICRKRI